MLSAAICRFYGCVAGVDLLLESGSAMPAARTFADFDAESYEGWVATGNCFGTGPAAGGFASQDPVLDFQGRGLVNTSLNGDNSLTGTLTSPIFTIERPYIRFLIGGGNYPGTCALNLLRGTQVVRTATGRETERLQWMCWDVRQLMGEQARLQIVDMETGSWGHILVDQIEFSDAPLLQVALWQELALVRAAHPLFKEIRVYSPYLNGELVGAPVVLAPNYLPSGLLRVGGRGYNLRRGQFYGLVDEVAVYSRPFSQEELRRRVFTPARLTGTEDRLLAGWTFTRASLPPILAQPLTLSGSAQFVTTSPGTDSERDAAKLPVPTHTVSAVLPFPVEEEWKVTQAFDERLRSHSGVAAFCWDFSRASGSTNGASVYACAAGTVKFVKENDPKDDNRVEILVAAEEYHAYIHTRDPSPVKADTSVKKGDQVAVIGKFNHLHFTLEDQLDQTDGFVTRPLTFRNYERKEQNGSWTPIDVGMPRFGDIIRRAQNRVIVTLKPRILTYDRPTSLEVITVDADAGAIASGMVTLYNYRNGSLVQQIFPTNQPTTVTLRRKRGDDFLDFLYPWFEIDVPGFPVVRINLPEGEPG